jgi:hypothetical protein
MLREVKPALCRLIKNVQMQGAAIPRSEAYMEVRRSNEE